MKKNLRVAATVAVCALFATTLLPVGSAHAAEYRLAVEPSFSPEQAAEVYQPLVNYLNRSTGHHFELALASDYHAYWRDLRDNTPVDFAFDEAHFVDYRLQFHGFVPVARTAEPTVYALIALPDYEDQDPRVLIAKPVACMSAPSLGFALLTEIYHNNPLAQPIVRSEAASWRDAVQMVFGGEAEGAIVPAHLAEEFYNLPTLVLTKPLPGRAFTAAPSVPVEVVAAVAEALEALHEDPDLYNVLAELGATRFVAATAAEYAGNEKILSGFYGYRKATRAATKPDATAPTEAAETTDTTTPAEADAAPTP